MKKLLLTGFEPFPPFSANPTEKVVNALDEKDIGSFRVTGRVLPVIFEEAGSRILEWIAELEPDAVLSLGLAAGRSRLSLERVALNYHAGTDTSGTQQEEALIEPEGDTAYFATLPLGSMVNHIVEYGLPTEISNTAGTFVCNYVMYRVLQMCKDRGLSMPAGFIHLPADHSLSILHPAYPGWSIEDLIRGVRLAVEGLSKTEQA